MQVRNAIRDINEGLYLPGLQREFVWDEGQIEDLFDSLMREFPVGIVTLWNVKHKDDSYHTYKMVSNLIIEEGRVPERIIDEFDYTRSIRQHDNSEADTLVIDGQQRLTSLNIGLFGKLADYKVGTGHSKDRPENWSALRLFVDIVGHEDYDEEYLHGDYDFKFKEVGRLDEASADIDETNEEKIRIWVPLSRFFAEDRSPRPISEVNDEINNVISDLTVSEDQRDKLKEAANTVVNEIKSRVIEAEIPTKKVEKDAEEVKEIFQRMNLKGDRPKPYQILLSRMMTEWALEEEGFNPREKLNDWMEDFKRNHEDYDTSINRELFLRYSCYLVNSQLKMKHIEELSDEKMENMEKYWLGSLNKDTEGNFTDYDFEWFKRSLNKALNTVEEIGFDESTFDTMAVIAALGKFYYMNPRAEVEDNLNDIFRFLSHLLLYRHTKGSIGRVEARKLSEFLEDSGWDKYSSFPVEEAINAVDASLADEDLDDIFDDIRYRGEESSKFSSLDIPALLGIATKSYNQDNIGDYDIDHIFPKSKFEQVKDAVEADGEDVSPNRLGNLQLISAEENREKKGEKLPANWLEQRPEPISASIKESNLYPNDVELEPRNYLEFVEKREEELKEKIRRETSEEQ